MSQQVKYKPEYAEQAYKLCLLGITGSELVDFFGVSPDTFSKWQVRYKELDKAVKEGMQLADAAVAERLYQKAIGFSHESATTYNEDGTPGKVTCKHYPPDTAAAIFWLKNRQSDKWGKKEEELLEHTIDVKIED
jgi:hypothetical protein